MIQHTHTNRRAETNKLNRPTQVGAFRVPLIVVDASNKPSAPADLGKRRCGDFGTAEVKLLLPDPGFEFGGIVAE